MLCLLVEKCHVGGFLQEAGYERTDWMWITLKKTVLTTIRNYRVAYKAPGRNYGRGYELLH